MNKTFITIATSLMAAALPGVAHAQSTANAAATGSTTIVRPITITKDADMFFGRIVKPATGTAGVQILNSVDELNLDVGVVGLDEPVSRAKFTIEGDPAQRRRRCHSGNIGPEAWDDRCTGRTNGRSAPGSGPDL